MTITVRGTDGSTENLHPMGVGHWIDTVFVMDQDNNVICEHEFPEPADGETVLPSYTCPDALAEGVTSVTSYEHCTSLRPECTPPDPPPRASNLKHSLTCDCSYVLRDVYHHC